MVPSRPVKMLPEANEAAVSAAIPACPSSTTGRAAMPSRSDSTAGTSFASDDTRFSTVLTTNDMLLGSGGDCGGKVGGGGGLPLLLADSLRSRGAGWDG